LVGVLLDLDGEVGLVGDQLSVKAEPGADGLVDLGGGIVVGLEAADGCFDEKAEVGNIGGSGEAVEKGVGHQFAVSDVATVYIDITLGS
jgi:hypothetical protein